MIQKPTDIAEKMLWTAVHGDQMQAVLALEEGAREIKRLTAENVRQRAEQFLLEDQSKRLRTEIEDWRAKLANQCGQTLSARYERDHLRERLRKS